MEWYLLHSEKKFWGTNKEFDKLSEDKKYIFSLCSGKTYFNYKEI